MGENGNAWYFWVKETGVSPLLLPGDSPGDWPLSAVTWGGGSSAL